MKLGHLVPCQHIEIWAPRYKDRVILIAKYKVGTHNRITFTRAKHLPGVYYLSGEQIRKCPLQTNGKVDCYAVPVDELEPLEQV